MKSMLQFTLQTLCALTLAAVMPAASAQSYPVKPIRFVVPYPPGGPTDILGRAVAQALSDSLGQSVIIDNKPGASGMIGAEQVAKAAPDGYTILVNASIHVINPSLYSKTSFDAMKDFVPVSQIASVPLILVVGQSVPANSVKDLIALAKSRPGKLNYGSSGTGGSPHLATVLFASTTGTDLTHVPYKGLGPALTDLMGGQVDFLFADVGLVLPHRKAGKLKVLAVTGEKRSSVMPDLPTVAESGLAGYQTGTW